MFSPQPPTQQIRYLAIRGITKPLHKTPCQNRTVNFLAMTNNPIRYVQPRLTVPPHAVLPARGWLPIVPKGFVQLSDLVEAEWPKVGGSDLSRLAIGNRMRELASAPDVGMHYTAMGNFEHLDPVAGEANFSARP